LGKHPARVESAARRDMPPKTVALLPSFFGHLLMIFSESRVLLGLIAIDAN
jgi:hypothetical protein